MKDPKDFLQCPKDLKKTWMDCFEDLARSFEHLNFPAYLSNSRVFLQHQKWIVKYYVKKFVKESQ